MKICIVSDLYYPYPGGIAEHVYHTACELKKLGHDVKILSTNYPWLKSKDVEHPDIDVLRVGRAHRVSINKSVGIIPMGFHLSRKIRSILNSYNFDIIHIHAPNSFLALRVVKYSKAKNIATFHAASPELKWHKFLYPFIQPYIRKVDGAIAVSSVALETMQRALISKTKPLAIIIPNGVDAERFSPMLEPIPELKKEGKFNILFVGRFEPRKGLEYLISAFRIVRQQIPSAQLVVVGKGWAKSLFNDNAKFGSPEGIKFAGFVEHSLLPRYYASCNVFCSPATDRESFGIVLLEGMASGSAVIASRIPGYSQVITDGEDGLLFEPQNPSAIADAIIKIYKDVELRDRLVGNGRRTALKYSWSKVTKEIENFYNTVNK